MEIFENIIFSNYTLIYNQRIFFFLLKLYYFEITSFSIHMKVLINIYKFKYIALISKNTKNHKMYYHFNEMCIIYNNLSV